jgi:LysM repeat protein
LQIFLKYDDIYYMKTKQFLALALLWAFFGTSLFPFVSAQYSSTGGGYGGCTSAQCWSNEGGTSGSGPMGGNNNGSPTTDNWVSSPTTTNWIDNKIGPGTAGPSWTFQAMDGFDYQSTPPTVGGPSYTTSTNGDKPNTYYYCGHSEADNYQTQSQCRSANAAKPNEPCVRDDKRCIYGDKTYKHCGDPKSQNPMKTEQCLFFNNAKPDDKCFRDDTLCKYNDIPTCNDPNALRPNSLGDCKAVNQGDRCIEDNNTCKYPPNTTNTTTFTNNFLTAGSKCVAQNTRASLYFDTMPNLNDPSELTEFNKTYSGIICTAGGIVSQPFTTNLSQQTFRITCINQYGIDMDLVRCTYRVGGIIVDWGVNGSGWVDWGINGSSGGANWGVNGSAWVDWGINGGQVSLYSISGTIFGDGSAMDGILVTLTYPDGTTISVTTDSNGKYQFTGLLAGTYQIRASNKSPYIFYSDVIDLNNWSISNYDITGINLDSVEDPGVAELLRRSSEASTPLDWSEGGYSSLNDWINNIMNGKNSGATTEDNLYDEFGNISTDGGNSFNNIFSSNSLFKLLNSGYIPFSKSYSPIALSLVQKFANQNAICGNSIAEEWETCDDGVDNGKIGRCSSDCLYVGEVRFTDYDGENQSNALSSLGGDVNASDIIQNFQEAGNVVSGTIQSVLDILSNSQEWAKQKIIENTSPRTREIMKQTAAVAGEVAKYSVVGVTTLLGVAAASLQVLVFKSQWMSYTVQAGDTIDSLGNKFTMTERALRARNGHLKNWWLREGIKIKVRNRHFMEKDYLDQLKSVLKDNLEKRHYGHMAGKIEKMFAKK